MILHKITYPEFHPNGELAYIDTRATIAPLNNFKQENILIAPNGEEWIRVGVHEKYDENGEIVWSLNRDDNGNLIS